LIKYDIIPIINVLRLIGGVDVEKRIKDELSVLKDIIVETVPVEQIYLFGSYANGTPNSDSDLDIYVVMSENADIREIDAMRLIHRAIRDKKTLPVDVVVGKEKKFNQRKAAPTIERQIVQEGVVLYG
jgi:predicted nucleotidyltransferase